MDKLTIGGLFLGALTLLAGMMYTDGSFEFLEVVAFGDTKSVFIVVGGTIAAMLVGFPSDQVKQSAKAVKKAFFEEKIQFGSAVAVLTDLSGRARREGLLSLEAAAEEIDDEFLQRGLRLMVDGHEPSTIESVLFDEIGKTEERHRVGINFFEQLGTYAPAMGMIGTLIGLVLMLKSMSETGPDGIGAGMAVALLTTLYGSLIANLFAIPVANKLKVRSSEEIAYKELIVTGLLSILAGENPRFMVERLNSTLAPEHRYDQEAA